MTKLYTQIVIYVVSCKPAWSHNYESYSAMQKTTKLVHQKDVKSILCAWQDNVRWFSIRYNCQYDWNVS